MIWVVFDESTNDVRLYRNLRTAQGAAESLANVTADEAPRWITDGNESVLHVRGRQVAWVYRRAVYED